MKIQIKNFCNIENLYLELFPGITCIRGASNAGKSALTHAIRALVYNKHSDAKIMQGKDAYMVGIIDGENKVLCKRNKSMQSKTSYQVNGVTLTKVGRNGIPEVQDALNIKDIEILKTKTEINFVRQFAFPFLLDKTPSQLYDFLANSESSNDLNSIVKDMKADLKDIADQQKRLEGAIDMAKATYETEKVRYNNLSNSDMLVNTILAKAGEVNSLNNSSNLLASVETTSQDIVSMETQYSNVECQHKVLANVEALIEQHQNNALLKEAILDIAEINKQGVSLKKELQSLNAIDMDLDSLDKQITSHEKSAANNTELKVLLDTLSKQNEILDSLDEQFKRIQTIVQSLSNVEQATQSHNDLVSLSELIDRIEKAESTYKEIEQDLDKLNSDISELDKQFKKFKVCPICNSPLE